jgi:fluoride ion exporter CrcB/FEX
VVNFVILVFVGGALGSILREFVMLMVPNLADSFPLDILVANLVAAKSYSERALGSAAIPRWCGRYSRI